MYRYLPAPIYKIKFEKPQRSKESTTTRTRDDVKYLVPHALPSSNIIQDVIFQDLHNIHPLAAVWVTGFHTIPSDTFNSNSTGLRFLKP